ncbi:MAG TPA: PLP-dependent transferase [Candidatus Dormibacteraeota bacterium]|jgi:cystathionine gamma-synthase|nr:PLP-dependent transferase [Candidatus Dormibacteraeota bacterium]
MASQEWTLATRAAHAGLGADPQTGAIAPPLVLSSVFAHGNQGGYEYGRERNPLWERLEAVLAALDEGAAAVVFSAGVAAIAAVLGSVPTGAPVVGPHNGYSGTRRLFAELHEAGRIEARMVDIADTAAVAEACSGAALCCLETITNPMLTVCDVAACVEAAHAAGASVMVDSTFTTPLTLRPLRLGADLVVHSLTKYAGGHSDLILGAVVAGDAADAATLASVRTRDGSIPGQLETWLTLRGLRTLEVRFRRQMENAATLAHRLAAHPEVAAVLYPGLAGHPQHVRAARMLEGGFGAVVGVEVTGGAARADAVCEATRLWTHTTSLGGTESTLERRGRYELDAPLCPDGFLRLSVGIEDAGDLWADLEAALAATRRG